MKGVAVSSLFAGLLLLNAGCGDMSAVDASAAASRAEAGPAPDLVGDLPQADLNRVAAIRGAFERWSGGVWDRQAAAVVSAYGNNGAQADCIEEKGMSWDWRTAISTIRTDSFYMQSPFLAPPERFVTFERQANAEAAGLEPARQETPQEPLASALDECSLTTGGSGKILGQMSEEELRAITMPPAVESLSIEWEAMLVEVTAEFGDPAKIMACIENTEISDGPLGDVPAGKGGQSWLTAVEVSLPPVGETPALGEPSSDQDWVKAQAAEAQLATAFWECHEDSFSQALVNLEAALPRFEKNQAADLAEAEQGWSRVRKLAGELGWTPADPLAGYPAN